MVEFRILGPLEVADDEGPISLEAPKQRATLAILLLGANRVVSVEWLAEDLYAGAPPVTAVKQVQRQISNLRKALGSASVIETRPPGYVLRLSRDQLDLYRFERLTEEARHALERDEAETALRLLREALALWRGAPLADLAYEPFVQSAIHRLEEIRLAGLEQRIEVELALGRHRELVGELEQLVPDHPLHEGFRGQLMLALYRSGRQAEALEVYRNTRATLVEEFGIEPSPALHELERAILKHDPSLEPGRSVARARPPKAPDSAVLVIPSTEDRLDRLLAIAEPLARLPGRELIIASLVEDEAELARTATSLNARRGVLDAKVRTAAFTTRDPAQEVVRMATAYDVELVLLDAPAGVDAERLPDALAAILERSPADVGVVAGAAVRPDADAGVYVPFGGGEHDWAALEVGAWLAAAAGAPLRLVGTTSDPRRDRRDASRLLADASLAVQRVVGVQTEPVLAERGDESLLEAVAPASVVVAGISPRWRREGIGGMRRTLVRGGRAPTLLVHRGPRPGGLAPSGRQTHFTWSIELDSISSKAS